MMAKNETFDKICNDLLLALRHWESGDLIQFALIGRLLDTALSHRHYRAQPEEFCSVFRDLSQRRWELMEDSTAQIWTRSFFKLFSDVQSKTDSSLNQEKSLEETSKSPSYGADYFDHIVEDPKMLSQLCDEVKEHMDIAQLTLIDLEHDSTNSENINKIFRAFHTIKSSAAFLGLKNLEESAHAMEDLLVVVRDGKLKVGSELADVIFYGIGQLKDLIGIIEESEYSIPQMIASFRQIDIFPYIAILKRILREFGQKKIGEILQEEGKLNSGLVNEILEKQKQTNKRFGELAIEGKYISENDLRSAIVKQATLTKKSNFVKVSHDRLNGLIDIVGELVVCQSILRQDYLNPELARESTERTISQLETITSGIKNLVLSMGMVPIAEIFNKLRVVVRNTAAETKKIVTMDLAGEETELDRNVIETIYDPLVHIVRNAIDHGIESPDVRESLGKPRVGKLHVSAQHRGNGIEISVSDDGGGLDRERILAKAIRMNLLHESQASTLSDSEIHSFLFLPGFSTKETATEVSGRGVGLDVVQQNIQQIHGKVEILSTVGNGTRFVIRIPLTLAIIDGFVTQVQGTKYIFPFNLIEEIVVAHQDVVAKLEDGSYLLRHRGNHLPIVLAGKVFCHQAYEFDLPENLDGKLIIVVGYEESRYGIAVDGILGKQEIVVKNLNEALHQWKVFSGGTIFGNGDIGFVVEMEEFIAAARGKHRENTYCR